MRAQRRIRGTAVTVVLALLAGLGGWRLGSAENGGEGRFHDVRLQTEEFIRHEREIELTAEQTQVFKEALDVLPAPCCRDRTATTCCCSCNMARSWWGLAKHLIAKEGKDAEEVRAVVAEWFEFIHPNGYAGDACYQGRCGKPFQHDGCGGMKQGEIVF